MIFNLNVISTLLQLTQMIMNLTFQSLESLKHPEFTISPQPGQPGSSPCLLRLEIKECLHTDAVDEFKTGQWNTDRQTDLNFII